LLERPVPTLIGHSHTCKLQQKNILNDIMESCLYH
jgi:hypothetical protein